MEKQNIFIALSKIDDGEKKAQLIYDMKINNNKKNQPTNNVQCKHTTGYKLQAHNLSQNRYTCVVHMFSCVVFRND